MVGAVIVRDEECLATGFHASAGQPHAEVMALRALEGSARGAEMFVTLEPCNHFGRTPPCTHALIEAGIKRCVIGMVDPDPRVSGRGIETLRQAGIECVVGVEEEACRALNAPFITRVSAKRPFVTVKVAMTLDGRIATRTGHSRWITGSAAREDVHRMRDSHDAVLVGTGTLLADDPSLTTRLPEGGRQSLRVVLDRQLRVPEQAKVFQGTDHAPTLLVTDTARVGRAMERVGRLGVDVLGLTVLGGGLDLRALMEALAARDVTTVLCEGGGELVASLLDARLVDRFVAFIAPRVVGGRDAPGPVGGVGPAGMDESLALDWLEMVRVGEDLKLVARPQYLDE